MSLTSKATCHPKKSWHSTSMMYNISGKTGFDQARYTNKNSGTTQLHMSEKCQNQIKIYAASRLASSGEQWRGKPSVLLANTQSRHATQTMPGHPQTTAKCMHHHRHSHQLQQNTQIYTPQPDWCFKNVCYEVQTFSCLHAVGEVSRDILVLLYAKNNFITQCIIYIYLIYNFVI